MLHKYKKSPLVEAEQFDGSDEMIEKYGITTEKMGCITCCYLHTVEDSMEVVIGDWIITYPDGTLWTLPDSIFKRTYEKVD